MKKIIVIFFILIIIFLFSNKKDLNNDAIRFRIISNSNNEEDIIMKEKVVHEVSSILFTSGNKNEIKENIINNLSVVEEKIDNLFNNNNYDKTYNIVYGMNDFPEKEYNDIVYPAGKYESLVIEIGDANGDNYWCFLYPSLCMINDSKDDNKKIIFKSKIYSYIKEYFM